MIFESQEQLNERLAYWKKVLRLQDWDVKAKFVRRPDLDECAARVTITLANRSALIRLMNPIDWETVGTDWEQDHENDLVHELLHLHLDPYDRMVSESNNELFKQAHYVREQLIESVAGALVGLERKSNGKVHSESNQETRATA